MLNDGLSMQSYAFISVWLLFSRIDYGIEA